MDVLVKICPACNEENPICEVICRVCMTNLASVSPVQKGAPAKEAPAPEPVLDVSDTGGLTFCDPRPAVLTLCRSSDGRVLPVADGGVLGRGGEKGAFFEKDMTVSRQHARVDFRDGVWSIEDLHSTNGTWVNGQRLVSGQPSPLYAGDSVSLSLACELKVLA